MKHKDEKYFVWAILAALYLAPNPNHACRVSKYKDYERELNVDGFSFAMTVDKISTFECRNNISVNVYGYTDEEGASEGIYHNYIDCVLDLL